MISPVKTASPVGESLWIATLCGIPLSLFANVSWIGVFAGASSAVWSYAMFCAESASAAGATFPPAARGGRRPDGRGGRRRRRRLRLDDPCVELVLGDDPDAEEHLRVEQAAELRAMSVEDARLGRREVEDVGLARDDVPLEEERGDVEAVVDVTALQAHLDRLVHRDDELRLLARQADDGHALVGIGELPLPLEARDLDLELRVGGDGVHGVERLPGDEEEDRDDRDGDRGPDDLEDVVAVDLRRERLVALAAAVADRREDDQRLDEEEDDHRDEEDDLVQPLGRLALLGDGGRGLQDRDAGAAGGEQHRGQRRERDHRRPPGDPLDQPRHAGPSTPLPSRPTAIEEAGGTSGPTASGTRRRG